MLKQKLYLLKISKEQNANFYNYAQYICKDKHIIVNVFFLPKHS